MTRTAPVPERDLINQLGPHWPWLGPAAAGAIVGLLRRFRRHAGERPLTTAGRIVAHLAQGLFAGWLVQAGLVALGHEHWVGPAAGLAAVMGSAGLDQLEDLIRRWAAQA